MNTPPTPDIPARGVLLGAAVAALVIGVGLSWLPDHLDGTDAPPPPTFPPGTR